MLLFTEGFDWTNVVADYGTYGKWLDRANGALGSVSSTLRFGTGSGNYWVSTSGSPSTSFVRRAIGSNLASGIIGVAYRSDTDITTYNRNVIVLFDTTANVQMGVKQNLDGTFSIFRATHANILGTSSFALTGNTWTFLELKWKISDSISSGDVVLYADGVAVITLAAASDTKNTANAYATHYALGGPTPTITSPATASQFYFDDHYFLDLTGSVNNDVLGSVRIQTLFPSGNGNTSNFTGSDGNSVNNYQQVDDNPLNIADYNDGTALNQEDTYAFTDTVSATSTVHGITINAVMAKTDTDPRGVKPVVRHVSTDYVGTEILLTSSTLHYQQVYEANPGTTSAWSKSDVDAAEFGLKVST